MAIRRLARLREIQHNLGLAPAAAYVTHKLHQRLNVVPRTRACLYSKYCEVPLDYRPGTSDIDVFRQIFVDREYRCLDDVQSAGLIVDCGANVGYSSAYFLTRFPRAFLIAVEPDPDNFAVLEKNLAPFSPRFRAIRSAVWCRATGLVLSEEPFGDGREWARTVRETRAVEQPSMTAVDIGSLLEQSSFDRISILKVDIEGAEEIVFASNYEKWLHKVDNLVIELHGEQCEAVFQNAVAGRGFEVSRCDELTVCKLTS